jgi:hypothetical protein
MVFDSVYITSTGGNNNKQWVVLNSKTNLLLFSTPSNKEALSFAKGYDLAHKNLSPDCVDTSRGFSQILDKTVDGMDASNKQFVTLQCTDDSEYIIDVVMEDEDIPVLYLRAYGHL